MNHKFKVGNKVWVDDAGNSSMLRILPYGLRKLLRLDVWHGEIIKIDNNWIYVKNESYSCFGESCFGEIFSRFYDMLELKGRRLN